MSRLCDLWGGRLPLAEAFSTWAVGVGLAVNLASTSLSLGVLAGKMPAAMALAFHLASAPVNAALAVAVWHSAGRYEGPRRWAEGARVSAVGRAGRLILL